MPLSSRVLLSPLLLLIIAGSTGAFSPRQGGKKPPVLNDILRRREDNDDDTDEDDNDDGDSDGDDGRYEFRLFAATTNFHENSRAVLLFLFPSLPPFLPSSPPVKLGAIIVPLYPRVLR